MYQYSDAERQQLTVRAEQFDQQIKRFQQGQIHPDIFSQLRLRNGLYEQRHAPMLRVAIPYGELGSNQLRALADVADQFDQGYGHFTTRQNIQFNWPKMVNVPAMLKVLAAEDMHAIQTSGSCIRNISTDHLAGVAVDEVEDPRPWCEMLRQWSTLHPEFNWLPRKFKFALSGSLEDRALIRLHDIGIQLILDQQGKTCFKVFVGGGMGRTPVIGKEIASQLTEEELLPYLQSILRVYNLHGRRDHKYKSRIKILVNDLGIEAFREKVEEEFESIDKRNLNESLAYLDQFKLAFKRHNRAHASSPIKQISVDQPQFTAWVKRNVVAHKNPSLRNVMISLKNASEAPGDITSHQMRAIADIADSYNNGEIRVHHEQNLLLPSVPADRLFDLWSALQKFELARANIGEITDMICCPGMDYCSLANADTIPLAKELNQKFESLLTGYETGIIKLKMSGCMNACGHHHVGDIGILGVDKKGEHWYQITLGGQGGLDAQLGLRLGPAIHRNNIIDALKILVETYIDLRQSRESFAETVKRLGVGPFKEQVYDGKGIRNQAA